MKRPVHIYLVLLGLTSFSVLYGQSSSADRVVSGSVQVTAISGEKTTDVTSLSVATQEKLPVTTRGKADPSRLSGTVVDASGAVIAGASVQVRGADSTVKVTTQSGTNGSFADVRLSGPAQFVFEGRITI